MHNKRFSYSIISFALLFCDWMNLPHTQRFIQSRNCKATEKKTVDPSPPPQPTGGDERERKN